MLPSFSENGDFFSLTFIVNDFFALEKSFFAIFFIFSRIFLKNRANRRSGRVKNRQKPMLHGKKTRLSVKNQTVMPSAVPMSMKIRYSPFPA